MKIRTVRPRDAASTVSAGRCRRQPRSVRPTPFTYDQLTEIVDPFGRRQRIERQGQVTMRSYDALNRLHQITDDDSTITYTYDTGNRITEIADSLNGTITRTYDDLDRR